FHEVVKRDLDDPNDDMNADFDETTLFLTNKNGFPIDDGTWSNMWKFAEYQQPKAKEKIRSIRATPANDLAEPKIPVPPLTFPIGSTTSSKILAVQKYFAELHLMEDAKQMIKESLPIKCLEAVVLGIYLTNKIEDLTRFAIGFKSAFNGHVHRHVVLGLYSKGMFGALGISRRDDLMYKPLTFKQTLTELIMEYKAAYQRHWHKLKQVKIGMAIGKNPHSFEPLPWKVPSELRFARFQVLLGARTLCHFAPSPPPVLQGLTVFPSSQPFEEMRSELEKFSKLVRHGASFSHQQQAAARRERLPRSASLPALSQPASPQRSAQEPAQHRGRQQQQQQQQSATPQKSLLMRKKSGYLLRV
uniref:Vasohibin 1 n=1 Tax=Macrostomum lignano TaxID=282301 RepID=A0A1I8HZR8_9PLAT